MAALVMEEGLAQGILVVPIHDSFIVQERHGAWLQDAMAHAFGKALKRVGFGGGARSGGPGSKRFCRS